MSTDNKAVLLTELANAAKVQKHQLKTGTSQLSMIDNKLDELCNDQSGLNQALMDAINQAESMLDGGDKLSGLSTVSTDNNSANLPTKYHSIPLNKLIMSRSLKMNHLSPS